MNKKKRGRKKQNEGETGTNIAEQQIEEVHFVDVLISRRKNKYSYNLGIDQ